jgi:FAD/FMN-containing dehydrogenase
MMQSVSSWGRVLKADHQVYEPAFVDELASILSMGLPCLGYGLGRSYGDACLNGGGALIRMHRLDRVLEADWEKGVIRAEAGTSLDAILRLTVPKGWFFPVTPGTKFVTLGGAVANDVHGKNHEVAGTFGSHVRALGLLRSTGETAEVGPTGDPQMFAATIGGLGLTGLILWVELQLVPVRSAFFETETRRICDIEDFFEHAERSRDWPYTVAWVDCFARGAALGRGLFTRARHATNGDLISHRFGSRLRVPIDLPAKPLSSPVVRAFNRLYGGRPGVEGQRHLHYDAFLFPLDGIQDWNRLYGRTGFFQQQSVVPLKTAPEVLRRLLELTSAQRQGSCLVVLKLFGNRSSPGVLSFPMEGATLALDFPNRGQPTRNLLERMADIVVEAGGRLYPAKDATMSPEAFQAGYPRWREVEERRDPALMSDFWRRVTRAAA